jgi:serine/threonine protein kinase
MDRFQKKETLGSGSFGSVYKALDTKSGEIVAIKKMKQKFKTWEESMALPEIKSLIQLNHPCLVKMKEVIRSSDYLYMILELVDQDMGKLIRGLRKSGNYMSESQIRDIMYQLVIGIEYIHKNNFFHRDLKPDNVLITDDLKIKISDFGLIREIKSSPPYTEYVATRWYRAPECVLRSRGYNSPVDIFAVGCIMAELYMLFPLFPGQSELDQMQ